MANESSPQRPNPEAIATMACHRETIELVKLNYHQAYDSQELLRLELGIMAADCTMVLNVGQSTRSHLFATTHPRICSLPMATVLAATTWPGCYATPAK